MSQEEEEVLVLLLEDNDSERFLTAEGARRLTKSTTACPLWRKWKGWRWQRPRARKRVRGRQGQRPRAVIRWWSLRAPEEEQRQKSGMGLAGWSAVNGKL